jgi:hypothetical protein
MSSVEQILLSAQGGMLVDNIAQRFGLTSEQAETAIKALAPALALGLHNAASEPQSFERLIGGVADTTHHAAFDEHDVAHSDANVEQGREMVAYLFGSSSSAGQIAQFAARDTGLRPDILNQLLPVLASVVLGGLFKNFNNQGLGSILGQLAGSGALGSILGQLAGGGAPAPSPNTAPASPGGGLGGLLGGLLGAFLGGRAATAPQAGPAGGGSALPGGLDPATAQSAIELIRKTLHPSPATAANAELGDILDQVFGPKR